MRDATVTHTHAPAHTRRRTQASKQLRGHASDHTLRKMRTIFQIINKPLPHTPCYTHALHVFSLSLSLSTDIARFSGLYCASHSTKFIYAASRAQASPLLPSQTRAATANADTVLSATAETSGSQDATRSLNSSGGGSNGSSSNRMQ
jgi:hypothetical protein